eukprot:CAMPEP_0196800916 /NCGR_PEP_ID=MMETSP1362-20130617/507_1 /TAXON_ID=163516 /ORGANISM="Leptocylindrus danicus, Strain CCMP1856" /LENGTH=115 /DNA_ID=CAMNT_0042171541 /DNA_START=167 /DNA_END=513 /DNA_ORIENTATION=+
MVRTRALTRGHLKQPTAEDIGSTHGEFAFFMEYSLIPLTPEHGVGAERERDTVEGDVASMDDVASRMTTDSDADDDGVVAPVAATTVEVPVDEDFEDFVDQIDGIHSALGEQRKS